jgi:hypothetical protein
MYYASMFQCSQLIRILVRTNHHCLRVGHHSLYLIVSSSGLNDCMIHLDEFFGVAGAVVLVDRLKLI